MRINKFLAEKGIASRRHADEMISAGRVKINGAIATLGANVEDGDEVMYDDEKCDIEILSDEPAEDEDDLGLDEEVFVYDENENYDE